MRYINTLAQGNRFGGANLNDGVGELTKINTFGEVVIFIINTVYVLGLAAALIFVIVSGIKMITSAGNEQKLTEARSSLVNAIIGTVIIVGYKIIVDLILITFTGKRLNELIGS